MSCSQDLFGEHYFFNLAHAGAKSLTVSRRVNIGSQHTLFNKTFGEPSNLIIINKMFIILNTQVTSPETYIFFISLDN